ncbi:MAG: type IX secretion system sortase PorU [Bacteroidales bacterium]|nr:type IX secretion system sortase PorU [Bacteroidales bacterium]
MKNKQFTTSALRAKHSRAAHSIRLMKGLCWWIALIACAVLPDMLPAQTSSVLSQGTWWRLEIKQDGLYSIGPQQFSSLKGLNINAVNLYGHSGYMLSEDNSVSRPNDLQPIASWVHDGNGNGRFDDDDYIAFYAQGVDPWQYDAAIERYVHVRHAYATANYYFLRTDDSTPHRVASAPTLPTVATLINQYTYCTFHDVDQTNTHQSGQIWVGEHFSSTQPTRTFSLSTPQLVAGSTVKVRYALASIASGNSNFRLGVEGTQAVQTFTTSQRYRTAIEDVVLSQPRTSIGFSLTYTSSDGTASGYLDFIELTAPATLSFPTGQLTFRFAPTAEGGDTATIRITNATKKLRVWDVSDAHNHVEMPVEITGNTATFTTTDWKGHQFVAFDETSFEHATSTTRIANQDIQGTTPPDMVIVANSLFRQHADRLASLHSIMDNMDVLVVSDQEVYNEYSSGKQDPMAIREMLRQMRRRAAEQGRTAPSHLLLFGKGTYDNRDIQELHLPTVVTPQSSASFDDENLSYCSDDLFGYLDNHEKGNIYESIDVAIGRLPAKTTAEADIIVNKIEQYIYRSDFEQSTIRGDWRNTVVMLADDADPGKAGDSAFAKSAEYTAQQIVHAYPQINVEKIYADAYVQQSGVIGSYYPDVNNALKQRMDYGCLFLNYIGHGATRYIGTERYIGPNEIATYSNSNQLAFVITSTCSFGRYDLTDSRCGAEEMLFASGAGIGVISAARPIPHIQSFNNEVCLAMLNPDLSTGEALRQAKNHTPVSHSICLLGDPALHLSLPDYKVSVTSVNQRPVSSTPDTATVLTRVTVSGEIQDQTGTCVSDFEGEIFPIVFDREMQCRTLANDNEGSEISFVQQKNILYKGRDSVRNGRFTYSFVVPRDVAYTYAKGKLSHYAHSASANATGSYDNILFGGFNDEAVINESRPNIQLFIGDSSFVNGGYTNESPTLFAILTDSLGINAVGSGIGHDIVATLDGNANDVVVLNDFYQHDVFRSDRGYVYYSFTGLKPGPHTLTLKAWNIYNYSQQATIQFRVRSSDTAAIAQFFAYPNPAADQVRIYTEYCAAATIKSASISIYNHLGQLITTLNPIIDSEHNTLRPIDWQLRSSSGAPLPHGLYLCRLNIQTADGESLSSTTKIVRLKQ